MRLSVLFVTVAVFAPADDARSLQESQAAFVWQRVRQWRRSPPTVCAVVGRHHERRGLYPDVSNRRARALARYLGRPISQLADARH